MSDIALTGDRPTGRLHLGHYAGSLAARLDLQDRCAQFLLIADMQALADNLDDIARVRANVLEIALDYLAVGLDRSRICLQSRLPALADLAGLYLHLVPFGRLTRNPTVREELSVRNFGRSVPTGFLCHPVFQAADITGFRATLVPVGADQEPLIQQAREIAARVNRLAGAPVLPEPRALVGRTARLPGIDGRGKMSKSAGNALALSAPPDEISRAVRAMFTDPAHLRASDPGRVEGNVVFACLDAFAPEAAEVAALKARYRAGGLGDAALKRRLEEILQAFLAPIRARREELARDPGEVLRLIREGTETAREITAATRDRVFDALGLHRLEMPD